MYIVRDIEREMFAETESGGGNNGLLGIAGALPVNRDRLDRTSAFEVFTIIASVGTSTRSELMTRSGSGHSHKYC